MTLVPMDCVSTAAWPTPCESQAQMVGVHWWVALATGEGTLRHMGMACPFWVLPLERRATDGQLKRDDQQPVPVPTARVWVVGEPWAGMWEAVAELEPTALGPAEYLAGAVFFFVRQRI